MRIRAGLTAFLILGLSAGPVLTTAAPAPLPPTGGVRIELLTHDARKPLRAGDRVTVTVRGEPDIG